MKSGEPVRTRSSMPIALCLLAVLAVGVPAAEAKRMGPVILANGMSGAGAGTLLGASAGLWAYGLSKNTSPKVILTDTIIGTMTGTVAGLAVGLWDASAEGTSGGHTIGGYIAAGTAMGALMGTLFATVPWALRDQEEGRVLDFYEGCIGAGAGGVIGGALGLGVALLDLGTREPEGGTQVTGQLGLRPEWHQLADKPGAAPEFMMCCRVLEINF